MGLTNTYDGTRDNVGVAFTVTDLTIDTSLVAHSDNVEAVADVLGTLIRELISKGIIAGTITTH